MNFSIRQLQVFLAIVQHRSTLAAAKVLGMTQPAVSAALAGLERHLGSQLFYRWKKRMIINDHGKNLLPMARRLVNTAWEVNQMFSGGDRGISGSLRVGASRTLASYVMPGILAEFATGHPAVEIEVVSRNKTGIIELIEDFTLDIGVIAGAESRPDIRRHPWLTDDLCIICSPSHPLANRPVLAESDIMGNRWILREEGSGTREVFYDALPEDLKPLNVMMVLDHLESIKRTVEKIDVLSCVSRFAIRREVENGILTVLEAPFLNLRREYSYIVHREKENSFLVSSFINKCLLNRG